MPRKARDPAEQILIDPVTNGAADRAPAPPRRRGKRATRAMAQAVVDVIEMLSQLAGHQPELPERDAAVDGLLAAARKSPLVNGLLTGAVSVGDYGAIVIGLGGLAARIGTDVAAASGDERAVAMRARVYMGTGLAYQLLGALSSVETGAARGADRADGQRENVPEPAPAQVQEIRPDAGIETR